jgi:hypothetical protein
MNTLGYDTTTKEITYFSSPTSIANIELSNGNTYAGDCYIPFSKNSSGSSALYTDSTTPSPLTYNPSTNTLSASIFTGTSMKVNLTQTDNTPSICYIPFAKGSSGNQELYTDPTSAVLTYDPSTSTLNGTTFSGNATTATTATNSNKIMVTSDNSPGTYYIPFSKGNSEYQILYVDSETKPLTYNPDTSTLTASIFIGESIGSGTA